ncbi:SUMF1/EgtB/PvdO family nonheme iron enzyme [Owenweeksia hongkongensis]|uniref:SUMF1/EgtB/PvdO family nonheme iron enzyme n=1 Tax=Owenweeksia hongkongensis TaxID=253245 RepID=UPI003A947A3D
MHFFKYTLTILVGAIILSSFSPYRKNPAGTSNIPGLHNTFLDKTEITNIAWKEYLYDIKEQEGADSDEYKQALPDLAVWEMAYGENFTASKAYDDYPLVGVSYQQAIAYCEWRSERVSEKEHRKIEYKLPSLKEYKMVTRGETENKMAEGLYSTNFGFRTFSGICENAAEMTNKEGVSIAGANRTICLETKEYHSPSPSLGFRCMAVLK